ncbi:hypothetical protein [Sphingosinicella sp.]|uniref:hypothetical protein n=1 Tax=Sphingosinicella sp. TaxID=1917971 RepID=UPI0035B1061C
MRIAALIAVGIAATIGFTLYDFRDEFPPLPQICAHLPSPLTPARYADRIAPGQCPWETSFGFKKSFSGTLAYGIEMSKFCPDSGEPCKWLRFDDQALRDFPVLTQYLLDGHAKFRVRLTGWENLWSGRYGIRDAYSGEVLVDRFETVELISGPIDWSKFTPSPHPGAGRDP